MLRKYLMFLPISAIILMTTSLFSQDNNQNDPQGRDNEIIFKETFRLKNYSSGIKGSPYYKIDTLYSKEEDVIKKDDIKKDYEFNKNVFDKKLYDKNTKIRFLFYIPSYRVNLKENKILFTELKNRNSNLSFNWFDFLNSFI